MGKLLVAVMLAAVWAGSAFGQTNAFPKILEWEDALRLVLERNPRLRAAQHGVRAAGGRLLQAGTLPNPSLFAEVEDFGGTKERRGFESGQTTVGLEQTIELGGKRSDRRKAAAVERKLAEWERDALRLDVIAMTRERFVDALAAQDELALSREAWQTAESIHQTVSQRVTAGKDSPVEEAKARTELALAQLALDRVKSRLVTSRKALCTLWGDRVPAFDSVSGDLTQRPHAVPDAAQLENAMTRSPGWARWADEIRAAELAVQSARSSRIPDLRVGAGVRQSQADNTVSFVAAMGVDLPVFDAKRGSLLAAQAELDRKQAEQEAGHNALRAELAEAYELLTTLQKAAITITRAALPAAEQAFAAAQAAYAGGKTGYLDIQDARRSLVEMRRQQIETLAAYHRAAAQVERLAGTPLKVIQ